MNIKLAPEMFPSPVTPPVSLAAALAGIFDIGFNRYFSQISAARHYFADFRLKAIRRREERTL